MALINPVNGMAVYQLDIAAGALAGPILIARGPIRISVWLNSGATVRVFKSPSSRNLIEEDIAAGRLTYDAFNTNNQSGFSSRWAEWATGAVVYSASPLREFATEGPADGGGYTGVIAIATGGTAKIQVGE